MKWSKHFRYLTHSRFISSISIRNARDLSFHTSYSYNSDDAIANGRKGKWGNEFVFILVLREYFIFIHSFILISLLTKKTGEIDSEEVFSSSQPAIHSFPGI